MKYLLPFLVLLVACGRSQPAKEAADLLVHNAVVYTVDSTFAVAEAFAVRDGKFIAVGTSQDLLARFAPTRTVDAGGQPIYPGFIDAHCHFLRYGLSLRNADLTDTQSWTQVLERVQAHRQQYPNNAWIVGRGWDQNDWPQKAFPDRAELDKRFPDVPVLLTRVDGHAAIANGKALALAGLTVKTKVEGGVIESKKGRLTGILVDNAVDLVAKLVPPPTRRELAEAVTAAAQNCLAVGLTTVDDAGLDRLHAELLDSLYTRRSLPVRTYLMLNPDSANLAYYLKEGPYKTDWLNVRSFKVYADGALGSRGAFLLQPYADRPQERGFLITPAARMDSLARLCYGAGFQMNTHCIGDSAVRLVLELYGKVLGGANDRRWRMEHAQVVALADLPKFGQYGVIPSVQPTHATSDMYWVAERLGTQRAKTAYTFRQLQAQGGRLALGSDFPVEAINPLFGFHAAVARQDAQNFPKGGYQPENALSRPDALRGMTSWAAYANFEEDEKGSITPGKLADFVILAEDILTVPAEKLRQVRVASTWVGGVRRYSKQ